MSGTPSGLPAISVQMLRRLPVYYNYLKMLRDDGVENASSTTIARDLRLGEVQVRKDMAFISPKGGRPRTGFPVGELLSGLEAYLGYNRMDEAVLVGVGNLGRALLSYTGFEESGMRIVAAFDNNPAVAGTGIFGKQVLPMEKLAKLCHRMHIHIGVIAVPAAQAQTACDRLVEAGIRAVWNFAPVHLSVPDGTLVQYENLAASLALLSRQLAEKMVGREDA